jgi:hypothetical protein
VAPTLVNSWRVFAAGWSTPGYRLVGDRGELRGMYTGGSATAATAFTLPPGYRPLNRTVFDARSDIGTARVDVNTNGEVWFLGGYTNVSGFLSLDGLWFSIL